MEVKMLNSPNFYPDFHPDFYLLAIVALLPLTAGLLMAQTNPYQALMLLSQVIRRLNDDQYSEL